MRDVNNNFCLPLVLLSAVVSYTLQSRTSIDGRKIQEEEEAVSSEEEVILILSRYSFGMSLTVR